MIRRVAIVGYAQSHHQHNMQKTREDMVFEVCKEALQHAGILSPPRRISWMEGPFQVSFSAWQLEHF